ncbi:phosphatidylinositol 4,5-bisphosphate 5-phosphatase A-like [Coccinella septempunctata]|uniref:phosphatidylinositol 4,5-bisphosphate 5-phosphatase A-like n=1 Tax=Coccinella septempunctata TaxID=41139 RepID=UPI001D06008C|nr:phosphatidylinositol 4,5-bisphosphate 5-phosphatase A-like [Coccinella septempunctata]
MENIKLYFVTYNVGTSVPGQELYDLLSLPEELKNHHLPDFYILSFQEVKAQPHNLFLDAIFEDPWTTCCKELLEKRDYVKLKSVRLQGLIMSVFALRKHLLNIREIESEYTRTGLSGMWGNKGAVSVRLSIYGCSMCFVNAHLSAHDEHLKDRVEDYNTIVKDHEFHVQEHTEIFFHDYVFWMGDLNFRLLEEFERSPEEIERIILKKDLPSLFKYDQLRYVMKKGQAFSELTEQTPPFPPTFKFEVGTNSYDFKRRPGWCDRILYKVNSHNYENITLKAEQLSYKYHPFYTLSDHKPVSADFSVKVFSDFAESIVEFDKISTWYLEEDNEVVYRVNPWKIPQTKEDWIGLFKDKFDSLDDYVCYNYTNKSSNLRPESENGETILRYRITFSELPSRCNGNYVLVYFSQSEEKVLSVLGISDPFPIVKKDSD